MENVQKHWRKHTTFFRNNLNAGGSAICIHKNLFPGGAVISHVITCQGRDHIVSIHSGDSILVIVDVHFEPDLTLRSLRERLRLIFPHRPCNPGAFGVMAGDFNFCEPEQGRFNVWNQTFTDGDAGLLFSCFFSHVFELAQLDFTRKDVTVNGVIRTCPELTGYLLIFLWPRHVIFFAILMSSKILVNVPSRGFTASSCPTFRVTCRHVLRKEGLRKESKHGERTYVDDAQHPLADDPRAVCVTHKSLNHKKHTKF